MNLKVNHIQISNIKTAITRYLTLVILFLCLNYNNYTACGQTYAPEGNARPHDEIHAGLLTNPLAPAVYNINKLTNPINKYKFASSVNLEPLRTLAVMYNSRVGILDTLARDTIQQITGRSNYIDFQTVKDSATDTTKNDKVIKLKYDPLFTFLDIMADVTYYWDKPIVHIEYLDLRRKILQVEFPNNESSREHWMKLTRLSPLILQNQRALIEQTLLPDITYHNALSQMNFSASLLFESYSRLMMIPPAANTPNADSQNWRHVSQNDKITTLLTNLGEAWRSEDVQTTNKIISEIAQTINTIKNPNYPPAWRLQLEKMYNGNIKFMIGYSLYFLALISLLIAFGTRRITPKYLGILFLISALSIHSAMFITRWILAERIPIQNQFESMLGLCLGAVIFGTITMLVRKQQIFGAAASAVGFATLLIATTAGIPGQEIQREAAILNTSYILFYHVNIVLFSYGLISMGAVISLVYLINYYFNNSPAIYPQPLVTPLAGSNTDNMETNIETNINPKNSRRKLLKDLDHSQMVVLQLAFWILGIGILLGAWWADHSWGRWWAFDPKETWALITWIIYLIVIHVRYGAKKRGLVTAWLSIAGFLIMLWTYFGVNLLLPGLHAYA